MAELPQLPAMHPVLGPLIHDGKRNRYEGSVRVDERAIPVVLTPDKAGDFTNAEKAAVRFAAHADSEAQAVSEFLAERYLERLNGEWRLPGQKRVSYAKFIALVRPDSAAFRGDGQGEFICGGSGLFEGHCLVARARPSGVLFDAALEG